MADAFWHPVMTRWHDQTGLAHALKPAGEVALPLCGARLTASTLGGGFRTAEEAGTHECRRCRKILLSPRRLVVAESPDK